MAFAFFGLQEYKLYQLNGQLNEFQRQIDRDKKKSDQAKALFKKFEAEEARIKEVDGFVKSKPILSDLLLRLGQTLPPNVAMDSFDIRDTGLALRISVRGASAEALGLAGTYLEQLKSDKELSRFDDFQITNSSRNTNTGRLSVDVFLKLKVIAPPAAKK